MSYNASWHSIKKTIGNKEVIGRMLQEAEGKILQQEVTMPKEYERVPNFFPCLTTKGGNTLIGRYTNHSRRYDNLVKEVFEELYRENKKQPRSLEELIEAINAEGRVSIKPEPVYHYANGKFNKPVKKVYLAITEKRGIYPPKQKAKKA